MLGAFYLRLVGTPADIYQYLEPLYNDYRKVKMRLMQGMVQSNESYGIVWFGNVQDGTGETANRRTCASDSLMRQS